MTAVILSFACGVVLLQLQPELPGAGWFGLSAFLLVPFLRQKVLYLPAAFAVGFCWALGLAQLRLADRLAPELEGKDVDLVRIVARLPAVRGSSPRLEIQARTAPGEPPRQPPLFLDRRPFFPE